MDPLPGTEPTLPAAPAPTAQADNGAGDDGPKATPSAPSRPADLDHTGAIEREEHVANVLRLRQVAVVGSVLWPSFLLLDVVVDQFIQPGVLAQLAVLRAVGWLPILSVVIRVHRKPMPSPRLHRFMDVAVFAQSAFVIALMCLLYGGISSPYYVGVILVVVARAAVMASHWKDGLMVYGITAGAFPVAIGIAALLSDEVAAQFSTPAASASFVQSLFFLAGTTIFVTIGGHFLWVLRRQVFEARNIGRYRLSNRIGKGGMGEVWAAYDTALKRNVALKILRPSQLPGDTSKARFEREVRATAELTHPNTIRVFDYGTTDDGLCYYAMELLIGESLDALVLREAPLNWRRAVNLTEQAARALAEAHAAGIVHRDIKPDNLFVTEMGGEHDFIKVLDFGIAKVAIPDAAGSLTATGQMPGTPAYMSPEVVRGQAADARSDVYALGATLYYLLTAEPPISKENPAQVLLAQITDQPIRPSQRLGKPLPSELEDLVMRCLSKEPGERFDDGAALAAALGRLLQGHAEA